MEQKDHGIITPGSHATPGPQPGSPVDPSAEAICVLDREGRVTNLNAVAERLIGCAAASAIGRPCRQLLPLAKPSGEPYPEAEYPAYATLASGACHRLNHNFLRHGDGSLTAVMGTTSALYDADGRISGAVIAFASVAASTEERRYRCLVAALSDFVWRMTPDGSLAEISHAWLELVGFDWDDAVGDGWLAAIHPDDHGVYLAAWRRALADGAPFEHEYRLTCSDGRTRWFVDRAVPVRDDTGEILEWIGIGRDITERREADDARRQEREQLRTLVESTSAILWEADPQTFDFTYVSPEAETLLGYPAEQWIQEPGFWVDHMHPEDREWAPQFCARATAELRQHTFDYRMIAADGTILWLRDVVNVIADGAQPLKLVGVQIDITQTKQTEHQLAYVSGLQRILVDAAEQLVAADADEIDTAVNETLRRIGEHCPLDRSYVVRFDDEHCAMTMTHEWHTAGIESLLGRLVRRPPTAVPRLVERMLAQQVLHVPRVAELGPEWATDSQVHEAQSLKSTLIVPIIADDTVYGYAGFDSVHREIEWSDDEIRLLRGLADTIGVTIQRDRADRARRESEARFRALAEHLPGVVYERTMHPDGRVELTYLSSTLETLCGITPAEIMAHPHTVMEHIHPDDRSAYAEAWARSAAQLSPLDFSHRVITRDGRLRWARLLGQPRKSDDGLITWHGITIDETDRVETEAQLQESRALQEIAGRTARVGGWVMDLLSGQIRWSREVYAIHELDPDTPVTLERALAFYPPPWSDHVRRILTRCAQEGTPYDEEAEIETTTGRRVWVRMIGEAVRDNDGRIVQVRGAIQDVTEEKEAREQANRLAEQLTDTLESITDAFFTVDRDWRITYGNQQAERLMGMDREEVLGRNLWSAYPDLVGTTVEHEYRRAMNEGDGREFEFFYPALGAWLEIRTYPSADKLGVYFRDITERKRAQEEIEYLALYDPLTQLPNRRLLLDRLEHALGATERTGEHGALLFLDLDHFKTLNDTLGHDIGDRMLNQAAHRVRECVRRSDTVARFGGDEFSVILEHLATERHQAAERAETVAENIRATLAKPYDLGEHERHTTVSVGITLFDDDSDATVDDVMRRADLAMYQAKEAGRGMVRAFEPSMRTAVQSRVALENNLRQALDAGEIAPWFQPQFDSAGRVIGAEALARWLPRQGDPVAPTEFIPVAEDTGLIVALGDAMLEGACRRIASWAANPALETIDVSVNVSALQFHHPEFVERVRAIVARTGAPAERLRLELTESLLLADIEDTIRKMTALRADGVRFTLDDFGTGYSSLAYLKRLPLDQLKIDQSFVRDALTDANDAAIVRTIIVLAHTMEMQVIAEGVETDAVRSLLAADGCMAYQGFLYSPAVPAEQFEEMAARY